jgi:hypothetical protein
MSAPHLIDRYHYTSGWAEERGQYTATCREFPDLEGAGLTTEDALVIVKARVLDAVMGLIERHRTPPEPSAEGPFSDWP